jgi:hypothetical protein
MESRFRSRSIKAQSFVELAAGLIVLIPILLALLDLAIIVIAIQVNDTVCRDAARAASGGRPVDFTGADGTTRQANAKQRAEGVVKRAKKSVGGFIAELNILDGDSGPTFVNGAANPGPDKNFGGAYNGSYKVTTQVKVNVPAFVPGVMQPQYTFNARQEFPITYVEHDTTTPN